MYKSDNKNKWVLFLLILCGMVLGGFLSFYLKDVRYFSWVNYGQSFGFKPFDLNLGAITMQLGLMINITIGSIIGVIIAILVYRKM